MIGVRVLLRQRHVLGGGSGHYCSSSLSRCGASSVGVNTIDWRYKHQIGNGNPDVCKSSRTTNSNNRKLATTAVGHIAPIHIGWYRNYTSLWRPCSTKDDQIRGGGLVYHNRQIHTTTQLYKEPESKVEQALKYQRDKHKEKVSAQAPSDVQRPPQASAVPPTTPTADKQLVAEPKKSIWVRIVDEVKHYYHGFRLLFIDMHVSYKLLLRVMNGVTLTRRERRQFLRTVSDMFRLVPFLVFVIIPFMELLLPVAIKLFPNMLPSTFQDKSKKEEKLKKELKVKLEMAKFLQDTVEEMALRSKKAKKTNAAAEFAAFIDKIRSSGEQATNEEILKYSKLFEDELTLDNLYRSQLMALCRILRMQPMGTNNVLRFQLRMKLRALYADDKLIQREGVESLTPVELQTACQSRGMRALGVSVERLRSDLTQWLELHLEEQIPTSLLLLSRTLYLPETVSTENQLKATITTISDNMAEEAKVKITEMEGQINHKVKIDLIKKEEQAIQRERAEKNADVQAVKVSEEITEPIARADEKELMADAAPVTPDAAKVIPAETEVVVDMKPKEEEIPVKLLQEIGEVVSNISEEKRKKIRESEDLAELQEDVEEYMEDLEDLQKEFSQAGLEAELAETRGSIIISKRINKMINRMHDIIGTMESEKSDIEAEIAKHEQQLTTSATETDTILSEIASKKGEACSIDELVTAVRQLKSVPEEKIRKIAEVLDEDKDGVLNINFVMEAIELIVNEEMDLSSDQVSEIVKLLQKETIIDEEEKAVTKINKIIQAEKQKLSSGIVGDESQ